MAMDVIRWPRNFSTAPIYSAGVASVGPMLPSHSQSRAHSLSHPPILPSRRCSLAAIDIFVWTASVKAFKKRGKYRKRNKSGDNDISGSMIGAIDLRIVHHDENSMYIWLTFRFFPLHSRTRTRTCTITTA